METDLRSAIADVLSGDISRYEAVIRLLQQDIHKIVAAARLDWSTARDLVHQTFVDAYRHLDQFDPDRDFVLWIKQIARNLVRQELRSRACKSKHLEIYRNTIQDLFSDPRRAQENEQTRERVLVACKEKLPDRFREVLTLHYEKSFTIQQMAQALNSSAAAAKQLLWRARLQLRECVEAEVAQST